MCSRNAHVAGKREGIRCRIEDLSAGSRQTGLVADKATCQEHLAVRQYGRSSFVTRTVHVANSGECAHAIGGRRFKDFRGRKNGRRCPGERSATGDENSAVGQKGHGMTRARLIETARRRKQAGRRIVYFSADQVPVGTDASRNENFPICQEDSVRPLSCLRHAARLRAGYACRVVQLSGSQGTTGAVVSCIVAADQEYLTVGKQNARVEHAPAGTSQVSSWRNGSRCGIVEFGGV